MTLDELTVASTEFSDDRIQRTVRDLAAVA